MVRPHQAGRCSIHLRQRVRGVDHPGAKSGHGRDRNHPPGWSVYSGKGRGRYHVYLPR